jgi:hypothetical protein
VHVDRRKTKIKTEDGVGAVLINMSERHHGLKLIFNDTPLDTLRK